MTLVQPGTVSTQLFASKASPGLLESFLAPTIDAHDLAMSVIAQLETDESGDIYLPTYTRFMWFMRGLPDWLGDVLRWVSASLLTRRELILRR